MTATRVLCLSCWIAWAVSSLTSRTLAQDDLGHKADSTPGSQSSPRESIDAKRTELATELLAAKRNLESAAVSADRTPPAHLAREVSLIESIDLLYRQKLAQLQRLDEFRTDQVRLEADLSALRATGRRGRGSCELRPWTERTRPRSALIGRSTSRYLQPRAERGTSLRPIRLRRGRQSPPRRRRKP